MRKRILMRVLSQHLTHFCANMCSVTTHLEKNAQSSLSFMIIRYSIVLQPFCYRPCRGNTEKVPYLVKY